MGEPLCIGDYLCLYCEETEGFVYGYQSSSIFSGLCVYNGQDRNCPNNIPNVHAVVFEICIQNRYKLNKKYRKMVSNYRSDEPTVKTLLTQAKMAAEAEKKDNLAEQTRQLGKKVRYGEIVQLKHMFTGKFVHMCTTQTSRKDKNNMKVSLIEFNSKNAQFRIVPRYKVKSEGEVVQLYDQIVFESVKSPGHFFHASEPYQIDHFSYGSELNLGVERSSFTLIGNYRHVPDQDRHLRGGSVIRLFHKELEAYLAAEGLFNDEVIENVHFRIRCIDQHRPKSLSPSTSGLVYWQVEAENSILDGDVLKWEQQVRFRHLLTRQYLCIDSNLEVALTPDSTDPRTVFRLHSVLKERNEIQLESYARIENVLTNCWLHALKDEDYVKRQYHEHGSERTMQGLKWDGASLRKVSASLESMYDDAYTIQRVHQPEVLNFNFVAGIQPFLFNLLKDQQNNFPLTTRRTHEIVTTLHEIKEFIVPKGVPDKDRQKLLRNLRVIDLLVKLLQCPLREGDENLHMIRIFKEAYDVLHAYMLGRSRKNALYIAKYIDFFQTQFTQKGGIGLNVAQMIVELIRDKRKIVDRITQKHIETFIQLLRSNPNYRFLDLLQVLCVCDQVSIPNNQSYIVQQWLRSYKDNIYLLERGQNINKSPNIVYISLNGGKDWQLLNEFVDPEAEDYDADKNQFLIHQLDLMRALCFGRNDFAIHTITKEFGYVTWEDAFLCVQSDLLPDYIRAKFTELVIGLFVDVGNNYSVLDNPNICFVYEYVGSKDAESDQSQYMVQDLVTIFPVLRDWLAEFLAQNSIMTASFVGRNLLIQQVLCLLQYLVKFGYFMDVEDVRKLLPPLLSLLDGQHDLPFPKDKPKGSSKETQKAFQIYRQSGRYEVGEESTAIVNAKFEAMKALDLLLTFQRNMRLKVFVSMFKKAEQGSAKKKTQSTLEPLLYDTYNPVGQTKKFLKQQKAVLKELREMFNASAILDIESTTAIVLDLSKYKYEHMVVKSLDILNKLYSSQMDMFSFARRAQILLTSDSAYAHRETQRILPTLRRLARSKLNDQQVVLMTQVLEQLCDFCHLPKSVEEPHPMNQDIMISHGILDILMEILSQEIDSRLLTEQYRGMETVFKKTLNLLKFLIRENSDVQQQIFSNLDKLLDVSIVRSELAVTLKEIFTDNQKVCLKVQPRQIQRIVMLAADCQHTAPEFLILLKSLVKVESLELTMKRNQALVMKFIMQSFKKSAYVLDQLEELREDILIQHTDPGHLTYFIYLVDLLATCAEGENKFIESLCQTILPSDEIFWVLNHHQVDSNLKRPFIKFLIWVYLKASNSLVESGSSDLQHDKLLWDFINFVIQEMVVLTQNLPHYPDKLPQLLKMAPTSSCVADVDDVKTMLHNKLFFVLEGALPFLHVFYTVFYCPDDNVYPHEATVTENLASTLVELVDMIGPHLKSPLHLKNVVQSVSTVTSVSPSSSKPLMDEILGRVTANMNLMDMTTAVRRGNIEYYTAEMKLNAKFHNFTRNCTEANCGLNTVTAQLRIKSQRAYISDTSEALPLGEEFQKLVRCFIDPQEHKIYKRYARAGILMEQLAISAAQSKVAHPSQPISEQLDIRCLQILRALVHNEERKLPDNWASRMSESKIRNQINYVRDVQCALNINSAIVKVLPHLARRSDNIVKEVLAFICIMLFNANKDVQKSMLDYFLSTREEVFFLAVRDRMQMSTNAIKEKRSLLAQHSARKKETLNANIISSSTLTVEKLALQKIQLFEQKMRTEKLVGWRSRAQAKEPRKLRQRFSWKKKPNGVKENKGRSQNVTSDKRIRLVNGASRDTVALVEDTRSESDVPATVSIVEDMRSSTMLVTLGEIMDEGIKDMLQYKDEGYIELVLKLLARVCDGQHTGLQNYLREQPDNVKSFNIVGETAQFMNVVYATINSSTMDLVIQLFSTLNEFCSGNQENRVVVYDMKVIDYINFILRAGDIGDCTIEKVIELQQTIGSLIITLTEENGPDATQVVIEVKDSLDKEAMYRCMTSFYELHQLDKKDNHSAASQISGNYIQSAKSLALYSRSFIQGVLKGKKTNALRESLIRVGFTYYLILARMIDIDPQLVDNVKLSPENTRAFDYYRKNCLSIEIVKDDVLQKVNFRVKNKSVLRDEVKEKLKWNVDRTSPSNKIRDLMSWTRDIMRDISYQRKILDHPISKFFTKGWLLWNYSTIVLSLAINVIMLVTWNAKAVDEDCKAAKEANETSICPELYDPIPVIKKIPEPDYQIIMWVLSGVHNLFSLFVVISYFLAYHPRLPHLSEISDWFLQICGKSNSDEEEEENVQKEEPPSKLNSRFFSFTTFYYLLFLGMSAAGTVLYGFFFAFHLLNIVNNNQLLGGVIKAVTQNGRSLLWVAVLGLVVIYIYTLVGFALLRSSFSQTDNSLYCSTLWQCTVTVIRYGLVGGIYDEIKEDPLDPSFSTFWPIVIYHVSFFIFITTIGLNIIFGIIVDTFSELRDLKWRAESDMKDTCFICSRNSYDFEHHGKGFDFHVKYEHNMWAYVYFVLHLDDIKSSDYSALELYVANLLEKENYEFIPINRALCLTSVDIDSTQSKIDALLTEVKEISRRQIDEETEKKRRLERQRQRKWEEKHKGLFFGNGHGYESDNDPLLPARAVTLDQPSSGQQTDRQMSRQDSTPRETQQETRRRPMPDSESEDSTQAALQKALQIQIKRASFKALKRQKEVEDDAVIDSDSPSESGSEERQGSYSFFTGIESPQPSQLSSGPSDVAPPLSPHSPPLPPPPAPDVTAESLHLDSTHLPDRTTTSFHVQAPGPDQETGDYGETRV